MKYLFFVSALATIYYLVLKWLHHVVAFSKYFLYVGLIGMAISLFELYGPFSLFCWLPLPLKRLIELSIFIFLLGFLIFLILSFIKNHSVISTTPEVIFVFGAGLFEDKVSLSLLTRLQKALELASNHPSIPIIVSGGQGPNEWVSEAWAMKEYLINHEIDEARIIMEDQSTSTYENLAYSQTLFDFTGKQVALVSNQFHIYRAEKIASRLGIQGFGVAAPLRTIASGVFYVREYLALIKGWLCHEI